MQYNINKKTVAVTTFSLFLLIFALSNAIYNEN